MGTNFFWHPNENEELHICKRSGAGGGLTSFSFQGHRSTDFGPLDSWAKWKACLRAIEHEPHGPAKIVDEYGKHHSVEQFIGLVEITTLPNRRRQFLWMAEHGYPVWPNDRPPLDYDGDWTCAEGFSFSYRPFS